MIIDEIGGFSDFVEKWNFGWIPKFWNHIFYISTSPAPPSELFILGSYGSIDIGFIDEIHLTDRWSMNNTKLSLPSKIASPILHPIFDNREFIPIACLMETEQWLPIYGKIAIKLRILTLKKLPHSRTSGDDPSKKRTFMPIIWIDGRVLIDGTMPLIGREEAFCDDGKKSLFDLCVCIYGRNKCLCRIEISHFFICSYRVGDVGAFDFAFIFESVGMDDIDDGSSRSMIFYDFLCMTVRMWSTSFCGEENSNIFFVSIVIMDHRENSFLDHIIGFRIYRDNDDML